MELGGMKALLSGFRILSHAFVRDTEHQKLIALDQDNNLRLIDTNAKDSGEDIPVIHTENLEIVNVISQAFNEEKSPVLFTAKKENSFKNYLGNFGNGEYKHLFDSESTPMLITDPNTMEPLILYTHNGDLVLVSIKDNSVEDKRTIATSSLPKGVHTSGFLDLTGNMEAELALHVKDDSGNSLHILKLTPEYTLETIETVRLPPVIGPILFSEFQKTFSTDMIFVSNDNGVFHLNLYKNESIGEISEDLLEDVVKLKKFYSLNSPKRIFNSNDVIRANLNELLGGAIPVLEDLNGTPNGLFLADINGKGMKDIFILARDQASNKTVIKAIKYDAEAQQFQLNEELTESLSNTDSVVSVSVFDDEGSTIEHLLINTFSQKMSAAGKYELSLLRIDHTKEMSGISFLALKSITPQQHAFIPGSVFSLVYENKEKIRKASFSPQSSFPSLQRHKTFVGLGITNLFINHFVLKVPYTDTHKNSHEAPTFLVPNTFVVFSYDGKEWKIQSFFSMRYYKFTLIALAVIFVVFASIYVFLTVQDNNKYKSVTNKDSMKRVFNAL